MHNVYAVSTIWEKNTISGTLQERETRHRLMIVRSTSPEMAFGIVYDSQVDSMRGFSLANKLVLNVATVSNADDDAHEDDEDEFDSLTEFDNLAGREEERFHRL